MVKGLDSYLDNLGYQTADLPAQRGNTSTDQLNVLSSLEAYD